MKLLTIIIPVKNCENYIDQCLSSLEEISDIEILLADGGSTDGTISIVNQFINKGLNLKIISTSDNGQSDALNKLVSNVRSPFFLWLNADDIVFKNFIEFATDQLISLKEGDFKNLVSITSNHSLIDSDGNFLRHQFGLKDQKLLIKHGIWFGKFPCRIWNTKLVIKTGGFNNELNYSMDFDMLRRQFINSDNLRTIHSDKFMGFFRMHSNSKTGNPLNNVLVHREMRELIGKNILHTIAAKVISLFIRLINPRYIYYRFFH